MIVARMAAMVQFVPAVLAERWWVVVAILAATLLFGRVYCRFVCPLGICQSLVRGFRGPRRVCTRLGFSYGGRWRQGVSLAFLLAALALGLSGGGWQWLDPYALASRAVCVFFGPEPVWPPRLFFSPEADWPVRAFAIVPLLLVLGLAFLARGRIWCNWVCPVGTVLSFVSRFAWRQDKVKKCAGCDRCGRCFAPAKDTAGTGKEARA
jgi:polyferredoxin